MKALTKTILFASAATYLVTKIRQHFTDMERDLNNIQDYFERTTLTSQQLREIQENVFHNNQESIQNLASNVLEAMNIEDENKKDLSHILFFMPRVIIGLSNKIITSQGNDALLERRFMITYEIFNNLQETEICDISYMHFSDLMFLLHTASIFGMRDGRVSHVMLAGTNLRLRHDDGSYSNFTNFAGALIMHHNNLNYPGFEEAVNLHRIINISLDPARNHIEKQITHGSLPEDLRSQLEYTRIIINKSMRLQLDIPENVAQRIWYYTVPRAEELLSLSRN